MIKFIARVLCLMSLLGGTFATAATIAFGSTPKPQALAQVTPEVATEWATAVFNMIPVAVAAVMLAVDKYRTKKRQIEAEDRAASDAALREEIKKLKDENASLAKRLEVAEKTGESDGDAEAVK